MVELESFTKDITHSVWKVYQFGHGMLLFGWYVWAVVCWISSFCLFIRIWPIFSLRKRFLYGLLIWVKSQTIQWGHNILFDMQQQGTHYQKRKAWPITILRPSTILITSIIENTNEKNSSASAQSIYMETLMIKMKRFKIEEHTKCVWDVMNNNNFCLPWKHLS